MSTLFPKEQTANRPQGDYDDNGIWQEATAFTVPFLGSIQPANSQDIKALPQGRQNDGAIAIYSDTQLFVSQEGSPNKGDTFTFGGAVYELVKESIYDNGLIPHFKYLAVCRGLV